MKKSILFSIVAILLMSFSCSKEENTASNNNTNTTTENKITINIDGTTLDYSEYAGIAISVPTSSNNFKIGSSSMAYLGLFNIDLNSRVNGSSTNNNFRLINNKSNVKYECINTTVDIKADKMSVQNNPTEYESYTGSGTFSGTAIAYNIKNYSEPTRNVSFNGTFQIVK